MQSEQDIDFKPFFDMVVGVLFVLLILVAAQLFFTQWAATPSTATQPDRAQKLRLDWEREASTFVEHLANRLRSRGFDVKLDIVDRSMSLPLGEIAQSEPGGSPRVDAAGIGAIGEILSERLRCLPGQSGPRAADCPPLTILRLGQMRAEVRLQGAPEQALAPDRYARLLAALIQADLLRGAPRLLDATGSGGGPALRMESTLLSVPSASAPNGALPGDFALRFAFEPPPEDG